MDLGLTHQHFGLMLIEHKFHMLKTQMMVLFSFKTQTLLMLSTISKSTMYMTIGVTLTMKLLVTALKELKEHSPLQPRTHKSFSFKLISMISECMHKTAKGLTLKENYLYTQDQH